MSRKNSGIGSGILLTAFVSVVIFSWLVASGQNTINTIAGGAPSLGAATSSDLAGPAGVLEDASGNIYVTSPGEQYIYKLTAGQLSVFAGVGYIADHYKPGQANQDPVWNPYALAIDKQGNIYFADTGNNVIREVNPAGTQMVVAGNSKPCPPPGGWCGDNGPAKSAKLNNPQGVAVDSSGNIYIADTGDNRVRVVNPTTGIIKAFAGNWNEPVCTPSTAACGDGGPAVKANLDFPIGLAVDRKNNVYIADTFDHRIRMVSKRIITTVAGNGTPCFPSTKTCGDGGAPTSANLRAPQGVYVDAAGNIYIADTADNRIRRVTAGTTPIISTIAGTGVYGFSGDGGSATTAELARPVEVFVDKAGNVLVTDSGNQRVREITAKTGNISTIIGSFAPNGGDGGAATSATMANPYEVAVDSANNYFIADQANNRVRFVDVTSQAITTVAGNGNEGYSGDGGPATSAMLNSPLGVAVDGSENLYIADNLNHVVRCVAGVAGACVGANGGVTAGDINTVAGNGTLCSPSTGACGDGGPAYNASLTSPTAVAVDSAGNLFIADVAANKIREVSNGIISTIAGTGDCGWTGDGGPATAATLCDSHGVAVDASDNVYIADAGNNVIRCVLGVVGGCGDSAKKYAAGDIITYAYNGNVNFKGDGGPAIDAQRWAANEVAVDSRGNLFVGGGNDALVQRIDLATGIIVTVAGVDSQYYFYGFSGDGGSATKAHIDNFGLAIDSHENLLIADGGNDRIREVPLVAVGTANPTSINFGSVTVGQSSQPQPVTFTNTGADDLTVSNIATSGDFSQTNNCPAAALAPSQSCTIQVTFKPTKKGTRKGTLTITHNGYKGATKVSLTGTGI